MFPSIITTFPYPTPTDRLSAPSHSALENLQSSTIGQMEAFIGLAGDSSVAGSLIYDVRSPDSNGGGHVQTAAKGGTGQTTFLKGDVLIAQNSSTLTKLAVSPTDGNALIADSTTAVGVRWGSGNTPPTIRTYSSTLTMWDKPSILSYIKIIVVGGGATGSAGVDGGATDQPGSGGGAGGYSYKIIPASSILGRQASILAGGKAIDSYFQYGPSSIYAFGGTLASGLTPGLGGIGTGGDVNAGGGDGSPGTGNATTNTTGGSGGNSFFGGGGGGGIDSGEGNAGHAPGAGGGGGGGEGSKIGGIGANGVIIIEEY